MEETLLYHIQDLKCSYDGSKEVLRIPTLRLYRGKLYFLLGKSGIGKSTIIETLGMMNNTVIGGSCEYYSEKGSVSDLVGLWTNGTDERTLFRQKNLSFIFQSTNLMPSFTAGENMCFNALIDDTSYSVLEEKVRKLMTRIGLPQDVYSEKVQNLSGGQRQRIAFIRAFVAEFQVLFGDEPTGNLDPVTAHNLLQTIKDRLHKKNKTGVIVSHDIQLALTFADEILYFDVMDQSGVDTVGLLSDEQRLVKTDAGWMNNAGQLLSDPYAFLFKILGG